ncbi:uncharacterized protein PV06_11044 [Exophiala oligosperma]|uniref:Protein kinase domain-containing protein n=1 Tax=Exophiala oligosperma TaxID=215243 RepID=A0A0D2D0D7_9EURO|nr:uncharacterized protein PV06_11044 [Exophiala oligosperma]KIW36748.1 hypothetical protein PV06_11044 [Exophiala oligosperma]
MSSNSLNRRTRIDFDAIRGFKGPSQSVTRQEDHHTDSETPSRHGTGFNSAAGLPRALSSGIYRTTSAAGSKPLSPPVALGHGTENTLIVKHQSPWEKYRKSHCIRLGEEDDDMVDVADVRHPWSDDIIITPKREGPTPYVVSVKSFSIHNGEIKCRMLQQLEHENIVSVRDIFLYDESFYVVFEHMPMSLSLFTGFPKHLDEDQLTSILGQGCFILNGLVYLATKGLEHGSLTTSTTLINVAADQELCRPCRQGSPGSRDIRALGFITMELMQKYAKVDGTVGVDDLGRWPSDSLAARFLSETTSATSAERLLKSPLFRRPWGKRNLQGLADITSIAPFRGYRLPPS